MRYIGVDLHTTQLTVCYIDAESGEEELKGFPIDLVDKFVDTLVSGDKVAFEATGNSLFLYKKLLPVLNEPNITVVNTSQFKLISKSVKKLIRMIADY